MVDALRVWTHQDAEGAFLQAVGYPGQPVAGPIRSDTVAMAHVLRDLALRESAAADGGASRRTTLVLCGAAGVGKTVAAAAWLLLGAKRWAVDLRDPGPAAWMVRRSMFFKAYGLGRMNLRYVDEDRVTFARLKAVRFLVLDDLGAEDAASVGLVEELVDHRHSVGAFTLVTTNLGCHKPDPTGSPFAQRYGARTMGRLLEKGRFEKCGADNLRPSGHAEVTP